MPHLDCSVVMCSTPTRMTRRSYVGFGSAESVDATEARVRARGSGRAAAAAAATVLQCMKDKGLIIGQGVLRSWRASGVWE